MSRRGGTGRSETPSSTAADRDQLRGLQRLLDAGARREVAVLDEAVTEERDVQRVRQILAAAGVERNSPQASAKEVPASPLQEVEDIAYNAEER